jgi:hypothetical protein
MVTVRTRFVPGRCALLELIEVLPLSGGSSSPTSRLATGDPRLRFGHQSPAAESSLVPRWRTLA